MKDNLNNFNASQKEAICHGDGPALVLAGPGSGKTTVLTRRLQYLITTFHISPQNILVVTFTKAAAVEMQQRFELLMEKRLPIVFGTFHSVFYHILKESLFQHSKENSLTVLTEKEKLNIMQRILRKNKMPDEYAADVLMLISRWKNDMIPEHEEERHFKEREKSFGVQALSLQQFQMLLQQYSQKCKEEGKLDFDDMAYECFRLFKHRQDLLSVWQKRFRYILVDEYQDISPIQEKVLEQLALPENHLFLVGDDDQSIYGFRGAGTESMLSFSKKYPEGKQILLEQNYRSRPEIIKTAGKVIAENKIRFRKTQIPAREEGNEEAVNLKGFPSRKEEYEYILCKLKELKQQKKLETCAILCRTHVEAGKLVRLFERESIPYVQMGKRKSLYEHFIMEDITAYVRIICGDMSRKNFYRIMNRPNRRIDRESCIYEQIRFSQLLTYYREDKEVFLLLKEFEKDVRRAGNMTPYAVIMYVRKKLGYEKWLVENYCGEALEENLFVLSQIQEMSRELDDIQKWDAWLTEKRERKEGKTERSGVHVLTYHGCKGLEFETVFMPDLNEGTVPHRKAVSGKEIEEERRMFYVGMTRAKERLHLFYRTGTKEEPEKISRFLKVLINDSK